MVYGSKRKGSLLRSELVPCGFHEAAATSTFDLSNLISLSFRWSERLSKVWGKNPYKNKLEQL